MKNKFKEGDITPYGWEILEVNYKPQYKIRKRIKITTEYNNLKGVFGFYYFVAHQKWVETDDGKIYNLRENEFEFI